MTLFDEIKAKKIPYSNHYSDLYIPVTADTTFLIGKYKQTYSIFTNQVEGGQWFDIFGAFTPYWEDKIKGK